MNYQLTRHKLEFKNPFQLAHGLRTYTESIILSVTLRDKTGFGEATFPPYLNENIDKSLIVLNEFFKEFKKTEFSDCLELTNALNKFELSPFTRALVFNSLADLNAKLLNKKLSEYLNLKQNSNLPKSTFTITKSSAKNVKNDKDYYDFDILKIKLDGNEDIDFVKQCINDFNKPFCVDVNQGWENKSDLEVVFLFEELKKMNCILIEQPFLANNHDRSKYFMNKNILPVFADEAIWNLNDVIQYYDYYNGYNIKILKTGGIDNAIEICKYITLKNKKIIIGCMSESECGCASALPLSVFANFLDLDGAWLVKNSLFEGLQIKNGILYTEYGIGNGIQLKNNQN